MTDMAITTRYRGSLIQFAFQGENATRQQGELCGRLKRLSTSREHRRRLRSHGLNLTWSKRLLIGPAMKSG